MKNDGWMAPSKAAVGRPSGALILGALLAAGACRAASSPPGPAPGLGGAAGPVAARGLDDAGGRPPQAPPGVEGPSLGIQLVSKQPRYRLHGGEERIPARLAALQAHAASPVAARKARARKEADEGAPPAPEVDMRLRVVNRSKHRVDLWSAGDGVTLTLRLHGPGAVTAPMPVMHTMEMRPPQVVSLGPGERYDLPIERLEYGERGDSVRAYWIRPGDYTITPTLETAVRPAWPGTPAAGDGFGRVTLSGPPLPVHVDPR